MLSFRAKLLFIDNFFPCQYPFILVLFALFINIDTHVAIRRNFHRMYFSKRVSDVSVSNSSMLAAKAFLIFFALFYVSSFGLIISCKSNWSLFWTHIGPSHHKLGILFSYTIPISLSVHCLQDFLLLIHVSMSCNFSLWFYRIYCTGIDCNSHLL